MEMKDRIRSIMEAQHMTQQAFADLTQIGAATLSSIFNGRTRPTLATVEALKAKFPTLNTDWLLWGTGEMYIQESPSSLSSPAQADAQPATIEGTINFDANAPLPPHGQTAISHDGHLQYNTKTAFPEAMSLEVKNIDKEPRHVTEIRVYYDDQTYETFVPAKK